MNAISGSDLRSSFASGIASLLDRVEYRRVTSLEGLEEIGNLRQRSYNAKEFIDPERFGSFVDAYDTDQDCHVIGMYIDEQLVSTVRLHIATRRRLHGPTAAFFPRRADWLLNQGECYVDPSRFSADQEKMWQYPAIPYLTLRVAAAACEYYRASYCMSFVREDASKFYIRSFGAVEMEEPQVVRGFTVPMMLLGARVEDIRYRIKTRYSFFMSSKVEQRMLFAPESELDYPPLNVLPSAKHVLKQMGLQPSVQTVNL